MASQAGPSSLRIDYRNLRRTLSTGDIPHHQDPSRGLSSSSDPATYHPMETPTLTANIPITTNSTILTNSDNWQEAPVELRPYFSRLSRFMMFFGYGRRASKVRRKLVSLIWNLVWGFSQIVAIITLLVISSHRSSPTSPSQREWDVCNRPLVAWDIIWIVRICYASALSCWNWDHDRKKRARIENSAVTESSSTNTTIRPTIVADSMPTAQENARIAISRNEENATSMENAANQLDAHTKLHTRLSLLSSNTAIIWFITAHGLLYTSLTSCRVDAPFLWWTTFGVLCVMYLVILEVVLLGLAVFVLAPILFLLWNIFLLILGRHPIQNPAHIRPEISKLPRHLVDKLPLVIYIPHPPDHHGANGVSIPEAAYSYPPKPKRQKPRFAWLNKLRASRKGYSADGKSGFETKISDNKRKGIGHDWEDNFEQGEFPFVRLEGNRATCAICLMDFEEPTRVVKDSKPVLDQMDPSRCDTTLSPVGEGVEEYDDLSHHSFAVDDLKLEDAGEGAQPLRLLFCGHVFHKTCVDPWLHDISGRCPVCQKPVEFPVHKKPRRRRRVSFSS